VYNSLKTILIVILIIILAGCGDDTTIPKPDAQLALHYPQADYQELNKNLPYSFDFNALAVAQANQDFSSSISYPSMDAKVYLTYRGIDNNLRQLLIDGQKLSYNHNQMADAIAEYPFINSVDKVYGMQYEIEGNAASNVQFYVTDSTRHFLTAALYFDREPNYDSILPAIDYIKNDMIKMMETMQWNN